MRKHNKKIRRNIFQKNKREKINNERKSLEKKDERRRGKKIFSQ